MFSAVTMDTNIMGGMAGAIAARISTAAPETGAAAVREKLYA